MPFRLGSFFILITVSNLYRLALPTSATSFFDNGREIPCQKGQPVNILEYIPGAHSSLTLCFKCDCPDSLIRCYRSNRTSRCDVSQSNSKIKIKLDVLSPVSLGLGQATNLPPRLYSKPNNTQGQQQALKIEKSISAMPAKITAIGPVIRGKLAGENAIDHATSRWNDAHDICDNRNSSRLIVGHLDSEPMTSMTNVHDHNEFLEAHKLEMWR